MLTFSFVFLSFVLFAAAIFFLYRYVEQQFATTLKTFQSRAYRKDREKQKAVNQLKIDFEQLTNIIRQMPGNKNLMMPSANVKENMEDRYARENPTVVSVDGVQKVVNG